MLNFTYGEIVELNREVASADLLTYLDFHHIKELRVIGYTAAEDAASILYTCEPRYSVQSSPTYTFTETQIQKRK